MNLPSLICSVTLGSAVWARAAPNVIFFLADDHGPSLRPHLPAYGNHLQNLTPNIDRLAAQGVILFQHLLRKTNPTTSHIVTKIFLEVLFSIGLASPMTLLAAPTVLPESGKAIDLSQLETNPEVFVLKKTWQPNLAPCWA